ncbi:MAG: FapA family protein [Clostridium beijerinckii]|jgi:uncharacterized protein (DUF342 family)|nr:FapA family protein [Clostridium beijerinckii]MCI1577928.1 FapA family protein [Clostridium beijerinckii]MCI1583109.1 FapA family protein [Clostridium beijerinckii]MCI1620661.1 FapA family protein [Clostridium beijerinckii]
MDLKFSGTSLNECLEKASSELNILKEALKYKVIKEEKKFFRRRVEIEIIEVDENKVSIEEKEIIEEFPETKEEFGAKIESGKIIITESKNKDEIITIKTCPGVILIINGQKCDGITPVTSQDKIEYKFEESEPIRSINISITDDKMEAYVDIKSIPAHIYELIDQEYQKNLIMKKKNIDNKYPPKYTAKELKELLYSKGIKYGIIEKELESICNEYNVEKKLVAKGVAAVDDIPDEIQVLFKDSEELIHYKDSEERVDYRNRFSIANVKIGDSIGRIIPGSLGNDGQDIYGVPVKRKTFKKAGVRIGEGCKLENNGIIATSEGKPTYKGNTFIVNKLYKVDQVDLESGNIDFVGNVEVVGNVLEAMEVKAGNELHVGKNVESAILRSSGEIFIGGNILNSTVTAGRENVGKKQYLESLRGLFSIIRDLVDSTKQVKEHNLLGSKKDGEIVKILIENKFKSLPKTCRSILNYNMSEGIQHSDVTTFIINKLLGIGPLKINDINEFDIFKELLEEEICEIEDLMVIPTNIHLAYAQGSTIEASGSVFITGKGQYTCNIIALENIEFTSEKSVCRGGTLSAGSEIKLKTVGSVAGVSTVLKVSKKGRITADIAYNNTIFCFGEKQIMLEVSSKNVEAYIDKTGEITIDKFIL